MSSSLSSSSGLPSVQWSSFCHSVSVATRQCDSPVRLASSESAATRCLAAVRSPHSLAVATAPHRSRPRPSVLPSTRAHTHTSLRRERAAASRAAPAVLRRSGAGPAPVFARRAARQRLPSSTPPPAASSSAGTRQSSVPFRQTIVIHYHSQIW